MREMIEERIEKRIKEVIDIGIPVSTDEGRKNMRDCVGNPLTNDRTYIEARLCALEAAVISLSRRCKR